MSVFDSDLLALLHAFEKYKLKYLVVGGYATNMHGYKRATGDIDFWLKDDIENRIKLIDALDHLGYGRYEELLNLPMIPGFCEIMLDNGMYADFMSEIIALDQTHFDRCFETADLISIDSVTITILNKKEHLISKSKSPRAKDQLDFVNLSMMEEE